MNNQDSGIDKPSGQGKGQDKDQGKGQDKDQGKGQRRGQGKGQGKNQGKDQGKGQRKDQAKGQRKNQGKDQGKDQAKGQRKRQRKGKETDDTSFETWNGYSPEAKKKYLKKQAEQNRKINDEIWFYIRNEGKDKYLKAWTDNYKEKRNDWASMESNENGGIENRETKAVMFLDRKDPTLEAFQFFLCASKMIDDTKAEITKQLSELKNTEKFVGVVQNICEQEIQVVMGEKSKEWDIQQQILKACGSNEELIQMIGNQPFKISFDKKKHKQYDTVRLFQYMYLLSKDETHYIEMCESDSTSCSWSGMMGAFYLQKIANTLLGFRGKSKGKSPYTISRTVKESFDTFQAEVKNPGFLTINLAMTRFYATQVAEEAQKEKDEIKAAKAAAAAAKKKVKELNTEFNEMKKDWGVIEKIAKSIQDKQQECTIREELQKPWIEAYRDIAGTPDSAIGWAYGIGNKMKQLKPLLETLTEKPTDYNDETRNQLGSAIKCVRQAIKTLLMDFSKMSNEDAEKRFKSIRKSIDSARKIMYESGLVRAMGYDGPEEKLYYGTQASARDYADREEAESGVLSNSNFELSNVDRLRALIEEMEAPESM